VSPRRRRAAAGLRSGAAVAAAIWAAMLASLPGAATASAHGPHAPTTPIHHFVLLLQENHTFDNYFGTYPGADGFPRGLCVPVDPAVGRQPCVRPFHIGTRSIADLDHTIISAHRDLDGARMDGFIRAQTLRSGNRDETMGYYDGTDVPFYWNMADRFVLFDHFFSSALGGSVINHVYWVGAGHGNARQSVPPDGLKITTIFDRLQQAGVSWKFYVQNYNPAITYRTLPHLKNPNRASQAIWCPLLAIPRFVKTPSLRKHIVGLSQYYSDLRNGTLPEVAYIAPSGASEHPPGSLATGQRFVRGLVNSLMASRVWDSSAFMLAYDDWGGWYDHVLPPLRHGHRDGFRVPAMIVSPYARQHFVDHTALDLTAMLKFIEQNWNVRPLTRLDATAGSITSAFDFAQSPRSAAIIPLHRPAAGSPHQAVRDGALYSLYGLGVAFALVLIVAAARRPVRRLVLIQSGDERP
jgi:phospholipase C